MPPLDLVLLGRRAHRQAPFSPSLSDRDFVMELSSDPSLGHTLSLGLENPSFWEGDSEVCGVGNGWVVQALMPWVSISFTCYSKDITQIHACISFFRDDTVWKELASLPLYICNQWRSRHHKSFQQPLMNDTAVTREKIYALTESFEHCVSL